MFKAIAKSRQVGPGAEQSAAIEEAIWSSWIDPHGTSFVGNKGCTSSEFQESLRKIYKANGILK